jgi:hypothetical protein
MRTAAEDLSTIANYNEQSIIDDLYPCFEPLRAQSPVQKLP